MVEASPILHTVSALRFTALALGVTMTDDRLGGVPIVPVPPRDSRPTGRSMLHVHGGAYVAFSTRNSVSIPALLASQSGEEIISIEYALAPRDNWQTITDQVVAVCLGYWPVARV